MIKAEVMRSFRDEYQPDAKTAMKFARQYFLAERLNLANFVDQSVMIANLIICMDRQRALDLTRKLARPMLKASFFERQRDLIKKSADLLERDLTAFQNEKYEETSKRPNEIGRAIRELIAYSVNLDARMLSFAPTSKFLEQWGNEWNERINSEGTSGIRPNVLYQRKSRLQPRTH